MARRLTIEDFWNRVSGTDDASVCWPWVGTFDFDGYGRIWIAGKDLRAHRIACELAHGSIPAGACALHSCDNRACCNPRHLRIGTFEENVADRQARGRGRYAFGESVGNAKLSDKNVRNIREELRSGVKGRELARRYNVSEGTISYIKSNATWRRTTP